MANPTQIDLYLGPNFFNKLFANLTQSLSVLSSLSDNKQLEIECRIGRPGKLLSDSGRYEFNSSVDSSLFYYVKEQLDKIIEPIKTSSEVHSKSTTDNKNLRMIKTVGYSTSIEYQKKKNISSTDSLFINKPFTSLSSGNNISYLRFSISEEESDKNELLKEEFNQLNNPARIRIRERYEYVFDGYMIDLTIVDYKFYEIELEFSQKFLQTIDLNKLSSIEYVLRQTFVPPIKKLIGMLFKDLTQVREINDVVPSYLEIVKKSYFKDFIFREPRPKNISESDVPNLYNGYSFTNKLNGVKYRLLITSVHLGGSKVVPCAFIINDTDVRIIAVGETNKSLITLNDTLIDVELFFKDNIGELYAFDCVILQGKNNTFYSHDRRLDNLRRLISGLSIDKSWSFSIKNFFYTPNKPVDDLINVLKFMKNKFGDRLEKDNDGIIMTPVGEYIKNGVSKVKQYYDRENWIYKWKFPSTVSIDFQIKKIDEVIKFDKRYDVFELLVLDFNSRLEKFGSFTTENGKYYNPPSVYLSEPSEKLMDGQIIELLFDKKTNSFILYHIRTDKVIPNNIKVAKDTFIDMAVEFSLSKLMWLLKNKTGIYKGEVKEDDSFEQEVKESVKESVNCLEKYRYYHNRVKECLINKYTKNKIVLDLGAGKGGDLGKYNISKIKFLWAVEPNKNYLNDPDGFNDRLKKNTISFQSKVNVINTGAQDTKTITKVMIDTSVSKNLNQSQANIITSFFSMSFFFSTKTVFDDVINTINSSLSYDGYFIGTTIDGQRIFNLLNQYNGKYNDPNKCYTIERKYPQDMPLEIGNKIEINLSSTATVIDTQTEWLVPFEYFTEELAKNGIVLVNTTFLDSPDINNLIPSQRDKTLIDYQDELTSSEKLLNSLYRFFVFQKIKPVETAEALVIRKLRYDQIQKNSLSSLEIDKAESGNFIKIYDNTIFRTGVLGGGSCFYHSVLYCLLQSEYINLTRSEREKSAQEIRMLLSNDLTSEILAELGDGKIMLTGYIIYVQQELQQCLINNQNVPVITPEGLNQILNSSMSQPTVFDQQKFLLDKFFEIGFTSKKDIDSITQIIINARTRFVNDYRKKLSSYSEFTTHDSIEYIMKSLKINIFIITDSDRMPVRFCDCKIYNKEWSSIIIINLQGISQPPLSSPHYEPLSDFYINQQNEIYHTTLYDWDSSVIKVLYTQLCSM